MKATRVVLASLAAAVMLPWILTQAAGQQRESSLGEAARKVREQRKQVPQAAREWTNDTIATGGTPVAPRAPVAAPTPAAEAEAETPAEAAGAAEAGEKEKERQETEAALKAEQERLQKARRELELLQRDYDLQRQQFYGGTEYARDRAGKAALDGLQSQVDAKRQEIQRSEQKIEELKEKLKNMDLALGPEKQEAPTADEQRSAWAARLRPLREELARIDAEISRFRSETTGLGATLPGSPIGGSVTGDQLRQLQSRRREVERKIADLEDEARRAGVPPAWLR